MHTKVSFITRCVGQGFESYLLLFQKSVYLCNISEQSTLWWTTLSTRIYVESNYMQPPKTKRDECSSHAIDPAFTAALLPLVNHLLQGPGKADPPPPPLMKHRGHVFNQDCSLKTTGDEILGKCQKVIRGAILHSHTISPTRTCSQWERLQDEHLSGMW